MTNAINLIFCRSTNWGDQIQKQFQSGDGANAGWRGKVMCSPGYFVSGVASRFAVIRDNDQGLTGLKLACTSWTLSDTNEVEDGTGSQLSQIRRGQRGNFVSAVRVKYQQGSKLTGIFFGFEAMPVITNLTFTYSPITGIDLVPQVVNTATVDNFGTQTVSKRVRIQKQFEFINNWRTQTSYTRSYQYSVSASASFFGFGVQAGYGQSFSKTQTFSFGKQIRSSLAIDQEVIVPIPPCTTVVINTVLKQKTVNLPFTAEATFTRLADGHFITTRKFTGIWSGTLTSNIDHKIDQKKLNNCQASSNLQKQNKP